MKWNANGKASEGYQMLVNDSMCMRLVVSFRFALFLCRIQRISYDVERKKRKQIAIAWAF